MMRVGGWGQPFTDYFSRDLSWLALNGRVLSLVGGVARSRPPMLWWSTAPVDMSWLYGDVTFQGVLVRPVIRVALDPTHWVQAAVALFATALVAALYPAWRASRVPPADTLSGI